MLRLYNIVLNRIIDGDSMDMDIHLGFGVVLQNKHLRLEGVDTPESRTSDLEEKKYGLLAKKYVEEWCAGKKMMLAVKGHGKECDKFGRVLGDLRDEQGCSLVDEIIRDHHGVAYEGQNKETIKQLHLENRKKFPLLKSKVSTPNLN